VSFFFITDASRATLANEENEGSLLIEAECSPSMTTRQESAACTWNGCQEYLPPGNSLTEHRKTHADTALLQWSLGSNCLWNDCTSKATFNTQAKLQQHLKNIHIQPLICPEPRCTYKKPFRNRGDLNRHKTTAHSRLRLYSCPFNTWEADVKTFARKDKWLQHIRETEHDGDVLCPYPHCAENDGVGFSSRKGISSHFRLRHSNYYIEDNYMGSQFQCALGFCALELVSEHWDYTDLQNHLRSHHGVDSNECERAYERAELKDCIRILRPEHMIQQSNGPPSSWGPKIAWHECTICSKKYQAGLDLQ
jgi:hypothetical protein